MKRRRAPGECLPENPPLASAGDASSNVSGREAIPALLGVLKILFGFFRFRGG